MAYIQGEGRSQGTLFPVVCAKRITLKHQETNGDSWTPYLVWEFYLERSKGGPRLSPVECGPFDPEKLMT
jgi:hypothetical protein